MSLCISYIDPQLHQNITFDDQEIHVHCELTGTCLPGSLAIYVNVDNSSFLVPDTNACSYNDKETGTMVYASLYVDNVRL
jgi:hypothetical protein